ncbi:hypothetical protein Slin14017_G123530 [Septoria linicola]|nr:hypothetical protein Slin14017_G123530 [Septoria linicola]
MSHESDMTVRLSIPLILAQVVKTRRHLGDGRKYVHQILSDPFEIECSTCHCKHNYSLPINDIATEEEDLSTNKWSIEYDADVTPSPQEVSSLGDDTAHISFRGLRLISPVLALTELRSVSPRRKKSEHIHAITPLNETSAVLYRVQQSQKTITIIGGTDEARSFLYASSTSRMNVQVDSTTGAFAEDVYSRVDRLLETCARQYDFLTGCLKSDRVFDLFSMSQPMQQTHEDEEDEYDNELFCGRHAFDSAINFDQAPSTLDPAQGEAWVDVVVKTVIGCRKASESYFNWQLSSHGDFTGPGFGPMDLLFALGVEHSTTDFYKTRLAARSGRHNEAIAEAVTAISIGNPLGALALHVANAALSAADPESLRDRVKLRLLTGGYGLHPREYTRRALAAIGAEGVKDVEEVEPAKGIDGIFHLKIWKPSS